MKNPYRKFLYFLRQENALRNFIRNTKCEWPKNYSIKYVILLGYEGDFFDFVASCFPWHNSPEGPGYWRELNKKWKKECQRAQRGK